MRKYSLVLLGSILVLSIYSISLEVSGTNIVKINEAEAQNILDPGELKIILDNQNSDKTFFYDKISKEHIQLGDVPGEIEAGKHFTVDGHTNNPAHDGITHMYYYYLLDGEKQTVEFSAYFSPLGTPTKCSSVDGPEISITCKKGVTSINFDIKND